MREDPWAPAVELDATNAADLGFSCRPGCGLCCATSPEVLPADAPRAREAGLPVVRRADGSLGLAVLEREEGRRCAVLAADLACGGYGARPFPCRAYPAQIHALARVQVDLHLGCPGVGAGSGGDAFARSVAEDALRARALDVDGARRNHRLLEERLRDMGEPGFAEIPRAFAAFDATDPRILAGLYAASARPDLALDDLDDAVEEGADGARGELPRLLAEVVAETPPRRPDHAHPDSLRWQTLDLRRADPARALRPPREARAALAAHAARLVRRDRTWGHAAWLLDGSGYAVGPAAAYARTLADAGAGLLLRLAATGDARAAVASFEWHYWSLPTIGASL